jgi:hypothetical protein
MLGERAIEPIDRSGRVARAGQQALHVPHQPGAAQRVPRAGVERNIASRQRCQRARAGDPVDLQAAVILKARDRLLGAGAIEPIDRSGRVTGAGKQALHVPHQPGAAQRVPRARVKRNTGRRQR